MTPLTQTFPDEYLPKRLDTKPQPEDNTMQDMSDEPSSVPSVNTTQPKPYLPTVSSCDTVCYLEPPAHEMLQCAKRSSDHSSILTEPPEKPITCQQFRSRSEIVLGQKESARAITSGALENLIDPDDDWSSLAGQLLIHLNLNMVQLDPGAFVGLQTLVTEVRLLNTVFMHPDSFLELRHLRALEIDSGLTPVPLTDTSNTESDDWSKSTQPDKPMFLRLRPADNSVPISFNLETECHQCVTGNSTASDTDMIIVVFTDSRDSQQKKIKQSSLYHQPQFSMLFPQTCPKVARGLGCPQDDTGTEDQTVTIIVDQNRTNDVSMTDFRDTRIIVAEEKTPSLLILLSIWCSVLTLVIVVIVCVVYFCTKRWNSRKPVPKWFPAPCFSQPPSSPDNLSSSSSNSGFYNRQSSFPPPEKSAIYPKVMMDSQTSWNSLRTKPPRSTSAHSLREKHHRAVLRASRASIDRIRHAGPARRSIGSQTDFTEMDSDAAVYSSLRRAGMMSRDYFGQDPPMRTSSQFALSRMRYNPRLDGTLASNPDRRVAYPVQVRYPNQKIFVLPVELDPTDLEQEMFIPMDTETAVNPQGLPPLYPTSKAGNQSPAPWRRHIQNGLSLDV
ncbi:unnamed protein product [Echinostoma caproni]|uniref:Death domain-containing protein n=1 Tax=Echinostoma caproni TaxID=27848 RepID=A0A183AGN8_9TREM|nr:unnamed protein product [Echinostoma caproni]